MLEFSNDVSVVSESVINVNVHQNSKTMKRFEIKECNVTHVIAKFDTPNWTSVKRYAISFADDDVQLCDSMFAILRELGVACNVHHEILPNITLSYSDNDSTRYEFREEHDCIVLTKHCKTIYYTEK